MLRKICPNCGREISSLGIQCVCMFEKENEAHKSKEREENGFGDLKVKISVDMTELDEALRKTTELANVLKKIDTLYGRITNDMNKLNNNALKNNANFGGQNMKVTIEMEKPRTCGDCKFYSISPYSCHNERGYQANCSMGYMKGHDTRDWDMRNMLFDGCKLGK